jgi:hypothetical protein
MAQPLDIFVDINNLLQILILPIAEYWIVDDDTINSFVTVGSDDTIFQSFSVYFSQLVLESARSIMLAA